MTTKILRRDWVIYSVLLAVIGLGVAIPDDRVLAALFAMGGSVCCATQAALMVARAYRASSDTPPASSDAAAWATLWNNVSHVLLSVLRDKPMFSERNRVAQELWRMGYRPTEERVKAEIERDRGRS